MINPNILYFTPRKHFQDSGSILRKRNYRFMSKLSMESVARTSNKSNHLIKSVKSAYSIQASQFPKESIKIVSKVAKTIKKLSCIQDQVETDDKSAKDKLLFLISRCRNLEAISLQGSLDSITTEDTWVSFRALFRLKTVTLFAREQDMKALSVIINHTAINSLNLILKINQPDQSNDLSHIKLCSKNIALSLQSSSPAALDLIKHNNPTKIQSFEFSAPQSVDWDPSSFQNFQETLKMMKNLKSLKIAVPNFKSNFYTLVMAPVLSQLPELRDFDYHGPFFNFEGSNFAVTDFPKQLSKLKLNVSNEFTNYQSMVRFVTNMKTFKNLQEFEYKTDDLRYVNEFMHDLPHSLTALKKVTFVFGTSEKQRDPKETHKFHLNAFLDWIISLTELEELYLSHPFYDPCNCLHLHNRKGPNKLKKLTMLETTLIYNLSQVEVEYEEDDLEAILNLLLVESLVSLQLSFHMEPFKPRVLNVIDQALLKCKQLNQLKADIWFHILSENLIYKLEKMLISEYYVAEKELNIRYYELTNKKARDLVYRNEEPPGFRYSKVNYIGLDNGALKST